jgi:hypothetical protein
VLRVSIKKGTDGLASWFKPVILATQEEIRRIITILG